MPERAKLKIANFLEEAVSPNLTPAKFYRYTVHTCNHAAKKYNVLYTVLSHGLVNPSNLVPLNSATSLSD